MTIKPIDLQINIAQMHEVSKGEQVRTEGIAEQQHLLEKESDEKSKLIQSRLDENKKAEKTIIKREEEKGKRGGKRKRREDKRGIEPEEKEMKTLKDTRMGRIIDVKK